MVAVSGLCSDCSSLCALYWAQTEVTAGLIFVLFLVQKSKCLRPHTYPHTHYHPIHLFSTFLHNKSCLNTFLTEARKFMVTTATAAFDLG